MLKILSSIIPKKNELSKGVKSRKKELCRDFANRAWMKRCSHWQAQSSASRAELLALSQNIKWQNTFVSKCIVFLHNFVLCIWWQRDFISGKISYPSLLSVCQMNINTSVGLRIASYLFKAIPTSFPRVLFKFLSDTLVPTERSRESYFCDEFGSLIKFACRYPLKDTEDATDACEDEY